MEVVNLDTVRQEQEIKKLMQIKDKLKALSPEDKRQLVQAITEEIIYQPHRHASCLMYQLFFPLDFPVNQRNPK